MISITKSRIYRLESNLPASLRNRRLVLAVDFESNKKFAMKAGFSENPKDGDTILPRPIGPVTHFNAFGKDVILRDREKERLWRTMEWTRQEWAGRGETRTVTTLVDVPYYRYPRSHTDGPGHELSIVGRTGKKMVVLGRKVTYGDNDDDLLMAINVFLEIFGHVDILSEDMEEVPTSAEIRRLNWIVLPKGEKISEKELKEVLSRSKRIRPVELLRQERISGFGPDVIAIGQAGFTGYVIYVFSKKKIAVLESVKYGNASYVIGDDDWQSLSRMTKQELLSKSLVQAREIHTTKWFANIKKLLED